MSDAHLKTHPQPCDCPFCGAERKLKAESSFAEPTLLERVIAELSARRGSADMTAAEKKRAGKQVEAVGWECRAAGLAEAIGVCQLFNDAIGESEHKLKGRKDYLNGKATFQNPYDEYTKERQEWIAGWCAQRYGN